MQSVLSSPDLICLSDLAHCLQPTVKCVGENDIPESNAVKAMVATADCVSMSLSLQ